MANDQDKAKGEIQEIIDGMDDKSLMTYKDAACHELEVISKSHANGLTKIMGVTDAPDLDEVACDTYFHELKSRGYNPSSDKTPLR